MGRKAEATIEVIDWDPPRQATMRTINGPVEMEITTRFEEQEDGTLLTINGQAEFGGFFKVAEGLAGRQVEKNMKSDLASLKRLLENGSS